MKRSLYDALVAMGVIETVAVLVVVGLHFLGPIFRQQLQIKRYATLRVVPTQKQAKREQRNRREGKEAWEIDPREIKFKKKVAKGNFGEVWLGQWLGSPVAVKKVLKSMAKDKEFIHRFFLEIKLMSSLHHPNVVMFLGACITPVRKMCLVLEFCVHGSLHDFLARSRKHPPALTLHRIIRFAIDIARGVHFIHQKFSIIQRDLKARNVLVDTHLNAKVADFGLSRLKDEDAGMTACGTPAWTAPEIVKLEQYDEKVDVYSFGIVLWELIAREEPYDGQGGVQVAYLAVEEGLRPEIPKHCPDLYRKLIEECWEENPDNRPQFGEILERLFAMCKVLTDAPLP